MDLGKESVLGQMRKIRFSTGVQDYNPKLSY